jgi:rhodanese-related sulfurtransferase
MTPRTLHSAHEGRNTRISLGLVLLGALLLAAGCATARNYSDPNSLGRLIADRTEPYILVDVRTVAEFDRGHIPTAINIPVTEISEKPPTPDRNALIIVYCASGMRSATATRRLQDLGFTHVVDFGGISRWKGHLVAGD